MSHGGGESGKVRENSQLVKRKSGSSGDEFAQSIAKIAVAQICESTGFQAFQQSALDTLSDITVRYIHNLGKLAHGNANLAGRSEGNTFDIIQALEELGSTLGFAGASDVDHCIASSGTVRELTQYVGTSEDVAFAYSLPSFPVFRERKTYPSFLQSGQEPPGDHIPDWLPAFPDSQTYLQLPTLNAGAIDSNLLKSEQTRRHLSTDRSSLNLQQPYACNGSQAPSAGAVASGLDTKIVVEGNPFLAAPLQLGEKEVSHVAPPAKLSNQTIVRDPIERDHLWGNQVSVLDTFAPAIEAMKSRLSDSSEGQEKVLSNQRSAVQFKIGTRKKSLSRAVEWRSQKGDEKISPWSGKDTNNDDKKRRAEEILKQSMENPEEFAHL